MMKLSSCRMIPLMMMLLAGMIWVGNGKARGEDMDGSPVGYWQTIPDDDGSPSIIQIWLEAGEAFGKVVKILPKPGKDPEPVCSACEGELKDKPIIGMTILHHLSRKGDDWSDGRILDPNNGKIYKCNVKIVENGAKLKVRGYIGFTLLGRSQYWIRVAQPD